MSLLHRRNPTVKFTLVCALATAMIAITDPVTPALLYALAVMGVLASRAIPVREFIFAQWPFALFATSLLIVNLVTRHGGHPIELGPVTLSSHARGIGISMAARTLFVGVLSLAFIRTTDAIALMTSLHQHARMPATMTYAVMAAFRLLEDMPAQWQTIRSAQAIRDPNRRRAPAKQGRRNRAEAGGAPAIARLRLPTTPAALGRAAFTLLVVSVRRSERLSISMETRGLGARPRTLYRPVHLDHRDLVFTLAISGALLAVVLLTAAQGWLRGPGNLIAGG